MNKLASLFFALALWFPQIAPVLAQNQQERPAGQSGPGQQQQQDEGPYDDEVVRITTNLVQVDAVVTDKNGRHVTNLSPEDFEVTEDDKKQEITNFSYINVVPEPGAAPSRPAEVAAAGARKSVEMVPPARVRPEQLRRTVALVVDDLSLSAESVGQVRKALKKYLDEQIQPNDLAAILRTSSGVGALQQFTSDRRLLNAALERVRWFPRSRGGLSAVEPNDPLAEGLGEPATGSLEGSKGGTTEENRQVKSVGDTIDALIYYVRGFQRLPGRKAVVLFTDGLRLSDWGNVGSNVERLRRLVDLSNRASVVFYSVDTRGLQPLNFSAADMQPAQLPHVNAAAMLGVGSPRQSFFEGQDGMNYIARETGGLFIKDTNDINKGIQRTLEDQRGYYLIGYRPEESTFDAATGQRRFHKLKVRVKRPGLTVRSRTGFYGVAEPKGSERPTTPEQQLMAALASPFNSSGLDLRMAALFSNDPARGSFMRSVIHVDARGLKFSEEQGGWRKATIDMAAVIFAGDGRPVDKVGETREVRVSAEGYERLLKDGLTYSLDVPVRQPGSYQLRVAVRDTASERLGSASEFIFAPDLAKGTLALSGIAVSGVDPARDGAQAPAEQPVPAAAAEESDPDMGPAVRRLRRGVLLDYGYVIYNARTDRETGVPRLTTQTRLFKDGKLVFAGSVTPLDAGRQQDMKRLVAGGRLQVGRDMEPGDYVLQVVVTDTLAGAKDKGRTATQWVDFQVLAK